MSGDLYALMRAHELERRRLLRQLEREHQQHHCEPSDCRCGCPLDSYGRCSCGQLPEACRCERDPDDMQDDDQPYFWNRRD